MIMCQGSGHCFTAMTTPMTKVTSKYDTASRRVEAKKKPIANTGASNAVETLAAEHGIVAANPARMQRRAVAGAHERWKPR